MLVAKKVEHIIDEIEKLDEEGVTELVKQLRNVEKFTNRLNDIQEDREYYKTVNESLKDVWDNAEDDIYND